MTTTRLRAGVPPAGGILVIDKPEGPTSHDVVARARRALGVRQIGHTGTLDPMATGVLALVVGRATRLAQFLSGHEKKYEARIRLGVVNRHLGPHRGDRQPAGAGRAASRWDDVATVLRGVPREQEQAPPAFSAKKVGGVPRVRAGAPGARGRVTPARVTLHHAAVEAVSAPFVDVRLTCSAGFYVRSLAHDLGSAWAAGPAWTPCAGPRAGLSRWNGRSRWRDSKRRRIGPSGGWCRPSRRCQACPLSSSRRTGSGGPCTGTRSDQETGSSKCRVSSAGAECRSRHPDSDTAGFVTRGTRRPTPGDRPACQRAGSFASGRRPEVRF